MATAGNLLFAAAIAIICVYRGWSMDGPYYSFYGRDFQSSNTFSDPNRRAIADLKRRFLLFGGNTNSQYHNEDLHHVCSKYHEYNVLHQLKDNKSCLRATDVWPLLESLSEHNLDEAPKCRTHVIQRLSDAFGNIHTCPDYCQCHGHVKISIFPNIDQQGFYNCWNDRHSENRNYYHKIYNEYYSDLNNYGRQCTHHHIWYPLSHITDVYCQRNLIKNLADTFRHYVPEFECSQVHYQVSSVQQATHHVESTTSTPTTTHTPETTTIETSQTTQTRVHYEVSSVQQATHHVESTTSTPTTTHIPETTTIETSQTTQTRAIQTCHKYETISFLAHGTIFSHPAAGDCSPSDHRASEALVFQLCNTNDTHSWIEGAAVLEHCSQIPLYTPVATFFKDSFTPRGGQAGIFLGCLPNGFKLAAQECFANATVLHIENGGLYTRDPSMYHVVLF